LDEQIGSASQELADMNMGEDSPPARTSTQTKLLRQASQVSDTIVPSIEHDEHTRRVGSNGSESTDDDLGRAPRVPTAAGPQQQTVAQPQPAQSTAAPISDERRRTIENSRRRLASFRDRYRGSGERNTQFAVDLCEFLLASTDADPLYMRLQPTGSFDDGQPITIDGVMRIIDGEWASDELLDWAAVDLNHTTPNDHFIARPGNLAEFLLREDYRDGRPREPSVDDAVARVNLALEDARRNGPSRDTIPLFEMPHTTRSISLMYNITNSHYVHILLIPRPREGGPGSITIQDSDRDSPGASDRRTRVERELRPLLSLITMNPAMGWQDVEWNPARWVENFAQQGNGADCGFYTFAAALAASRRVSHPQRMVPSDTAAARRQGREFRSQLADRIVARIRGESVPAAREQPLQEGTGNVVTHKSGATSTVTTTGAFDIPVLPSSQPQSSQEQAGQLKDREQDDEDDDEDDDEVDDDLEELDLRNVSPEAAVQAVSQRLSPEKPSLLTAPIATACTFLRNAGQPRSGQQIVDRVKENFGDEIHGRQTSHVVDDWLKNLSDTFRIVSRGVSTLSHTYSLLPGAGRSFDTETLAALFCLAIITKKPDDIENPYDVVVSVARMSGSANPTERQHLEARAKNLFLAHHSVFSPSAPIPRQVKSKQEALAAARRGEPMWINGRVWSYSSTEIPFSSASSKTSEIFKILTALNLEAKSCGHKLQVLLLTCGWDGLTTNNYTWGTLTQRYRFLDFRLTLVVPRARLFPVHVDYGRLSMDGARVWLSYQVSSLARIFRQMSQVDIVRMTGNVSAAAASDHAHAAFLAMLLIINSDKVLGRTRTAPALSSTWFVDLVLRQLVKSLPGGKTEVVRNHFDLGSIQLAPCEASGCTAHQNQGVGSLPRSRGSHDTSIRCSDHAIPASTSPLPAELKWVRVPLIEADRLPRPKSKTGPTKYTSDEEARVRGAWRMFHERDEQVKRTRFKPVVSIDMVDRIRSHLRDDQHGEPLQRSAKSIDKFMRKMAKDKARFEHLDPEDRKWWRLHLFYPHRLNTAAEIDELDDSSSDSGTESMDAD
jgi:hypothetical protein